MLQKRGTEECPWRSMAELQDTVGFRKWKKVVREHRAREGEEFRL